MSMNHLEHANAGIDQMIHIINQPGTCQIKGTYFDRSDLHNSLIPDAEVDACAVGDLIKGLGWIVALRMEYKNAYFRAKDSPGGNLQFEEEWGEIIDETGNELAVEFGVEDVVIHGVMAINDSFDTPDERKDEVVKYLTAVRSFNDDMVHIPHEEMNYHRYGLHLVQAIDTYITNVRARAA